MPYLLFFNLSNYLKLITTADFYLFSNATT